jgi:hypothetical protein
MLSVSMQLSVAVGTLGSGPHRTLRRSHSSSTCTARRIYLSHEVASLVVPHAAPAAGSAATGLVALVRTEPAKGAAVGDALGRVCDSVYEASLDTCSLVLNTATESTVVRASLGVIAEVESAILVQLRLVTHCVVCFLPAARGGFRNARHDPAVRHRHLGSVQVHGMSAHTVSCSGHNSSRCDVVRTAHCLGPSVARAGPVLGWRWGPGQHLSPGLQQRCLRRDGLRAAGCECDQVAALPGVRASVTGRRRQPGAMCRAAMCLNAR